MFSSSFQASKYIAWFFFLPTINKMGDFGGSLTKLMALRDTQVVKSVPMRHNNFPFIPLPTICNLRHSFQVTVRHGGVRIHTKQQILAKCMQVSKSKMKYSELHVKIYNLTISNINLKFAYLNQIYIHVWTLNSPCLSEYMYGQFLNETYFIQVASEVSKRKTLLKIIGNYNFNNAFCIFRLQ